MKNTDTSTGAKTKQNKALQNATCVQTTSDVVGNALEETDTITTPRSSFFSYSAERSWPYLLVATSSGHVSDLSYQQ